MYGLNGKVDNTNFGVIIYAEGEEEKIRGFSNHLITHPPEAAQIKSIEMIPAGLQGYTGFTIAESRDETTEITEICPDIAVCHECLADLSDDLNRINYPLVNCTNCGPRFTIVEGLPYDRRMTSMKDFKMCSGCSSEYSDIYDRRFHAQPVACNRCGPVYHYYDELKETTGIDDILKHVSERIMSGKSVAVKGTGGYQLICNALDENAVRELRERKHRDSKPFAVMFRDILTLEEYCVVTPSEYREITSWRRPILILPQIKDLAPSVNNGLGTFGALLPYMPFHYMLFSKIDIPALVFTSGNISDEPVIKDDEDAARYLMPVTGAVVKYNREIVNRADDSVIRMINGKAGILRRSRGYVPSPVDLACNAEGILAFGAEQKNTFCIGRGSQAIMSQHIGDLKNLPAFDFFRESLRKFETLFRFTPAKLACDMHPDYLSSVYASELEESLRIKLIKVQHHHAHIASCMAENRLENEVIGVCMDGTGYGTDTNIWGGEFLIAGLTGFTRVAHFDYVPLPGGDKVADEPWRMAFSYLYKYFGDNIDFDSLGCFKNKSKKTMTLVRDMIDKQINSPLSSGAGRLFDAVSALLGICTVSGFDSEAPIRLESAAKTGIDEYYPYEAGERIIFAATLEAILHEMGKENVSIISMAISDVCERIRGAEAINKVVLSGGVFQNKYLLERAVSLLIGRDFEVFTNHLVPANDGGISLGQLIIASKTN
jgi:hydrogenase maturation protein HypF